MIDYWDKHPEETDIDRHRRLYVQGLLYNYSGNIYLTEHMYRYVQKKVFNSSGYGDTRADQLDILCKDLGKVIGLIGEVFKRMRAMPS